MNTAPDYDLAATRAMEILRDHRITETPITPLPVLLDLDGVRVMPFTKMAEDAGKERHELIPMFGSNSDAATFHLNMPGMDDIRYVVVYNMRLPFEIIWRGIARELGHIVLGHDGRARSPEIRMAEALCFAHHLLTPRPILRIFQESGLQLTLSEFAETTGCSSECVDDMRKIPCAHVPAELNRQVKSQFAPHVLEYINFHKLSPMADRSPVIDVGTFMDGYEE